MHYKNREKERQMLRMFQSTSNLASTFVPYCVFSSFTFSLLSKTSSTLSTSSTKTNQAIVLQQISKSPSMSLLATSFSSASNDQTKESATLSRIVDMLVTSYWSSQICAECARASYLYYSTYRLVWILTHYTLKL